VFLLKRYDDDDELAGNVCCSIINQADKTERTTLTKKNLINLQLFSFQAERLDLIRYNEIVFCSDVQNG
jgi:hypothetical protein